MRAPATSAELTRLGLLLGRPADDLEHLARFDAAELRALRLALAAHQHDHVGSVHARIARSSRLVPPRVAASVAARTLPARVAAGVVGAMRPEHAAEIASLLPTGYLSDVTRHLAPDAAGPVISRLPDAVVLAVSRELHARDDVTTMAEVVSALSELQVVLVAEDLDDPSAFVQIALRVTDSTAVQRLVETLPEPLLVRMVRTAGRRPRQWPHLLDLLGRLPSDRRRRLLARGDRA